MEKKIVAPCGIDCFNCEVFKDNVTEEMQHRISESTKIPAEKITCNGCSDGNICLFLKFQGKSCATLNCVKEKNVNFCYECDDFPCNYLMPLAKGAEKYPHNLKLFNLCTIKKLGIEAWADQVKGIRHTYFNKALEIGKGGSKS
ncbi:MAG TPA: DUF3795 domain-containing protein [Bacteroidales bacterium]|nr:DUF3795 domain-containing protein [Bacteroidales bacterium]HPT20649.1 DUF3795 domain-containing protein [Bacteroidales bacterium]